MGIGIPQNMGNSPMAGYSEYNDPPSPSYTEIVNICQ